MSDGFFRTLLVVDEIAEDFITIEIPARDSDKNINSQEKHFLMVYNAANIYSLNRISELITMMI